MVSTRGAGSGINYAEDQYAAPSGSRRSSRASGRRSHNDEDDGASSVSHQQRGPSPRIKAIYSRRTSRSSAPISKGRNNNDDDAGDQGDDEQEGEGDRSRDDDGSRRPRRAAASKQTTAYTEVPTDADDSPSGFAPRIQKLRIRARTSSARVRANATSTVSPKHFTLSFTHLSSLSSSTSTDSRRWQRRRRMFGAARAARSGGAWTGVGRLA